MADIFARSWRAVAAALLLTIGLHAAMPVGQPLQRIAGSAFSAATADVSLTQGRRTQVAKRVAAKFGALPEMGIPISAPSIPDARAGGALPSGFDATAPPAAFTFSPLAPRAPPIA